MNYESLIFDIDGTLWDSRALVAEGYNIQLEQGRAFPVLHHGGDPETPVRPGDDGDRRRSSLPTFRKRSATP